ncbi:MAG: hypothetical protein L0Y44_01905 [Phycisphaerales bacterium]|nr:hypothetical protein [Phycisphaerales bacterium]MCI0674623.1 hypothetical protein [Phycisphaerales bacterium]
MSDVIKRVLVSLVLGALTTIGVAWNCVLLVEPLTGKLSGSFQFNTSDSWSCWIFQRSGAVLVQRTPMRPSSTTKLLTGPSGLTLWHGEPIPQIPSWSRVHQPPSGEELQIRGTMIEDARGWPVVTMVSRYAVGSKTPGAQGSTPHMPFWLLSRSGTLPRTIPMSPIWPNFATSAVGWGGLWLVLLVAPGAVRRCRRARNGWCVACGYDLRSTPGEVCPECGAVIYRRSGAATAGEPAR